MGDFLVFFTSLLEEREIRDGNMPNLLEKISPFGLVLVGEIVFPPYHGYRSKREMEP